ncbi:ras-related protein Rab-8-like [Pholidichthys leucotaenia]
MAKTSEHLKLVMIGDDSVGKSSLMKRFTEDWFRHDIPATIGANFQIKPVKLDGKEFRLEIWDTMGIERFKSVIPLYYRGAKGIMLVYDITNRYSFENIRGWMEHVETHAPSGVDKVIVGNKCDLDSQREVSKEEGQERAMYYGVKFLETSAKASVNVDEAFFTFTTNISPLSGKMDENKPGESCSLL